MSDWKPNDEAHVIRVLESLAAEGTKRVKDKNHKQYKDPILSALADGANGALKVLNDHEATKDKQAIGKFIYKSQGISLVIMALLTAWVPKMKTLGMAVPE